MKRIALLKIIKSSSQAFGASVLMAVFVIPFFSFVFLPSLTLQVKQLPQQPHIQPQGVEEEPFVSEPVEAPGRLRTVVLDAGHGGKDPGCLGRISRESRIVLKLALAVGRKIKAEMPGVRVIYTRTTDKFIELGDRPAIANRNKADLFISIHCNASPRSSQVYGTETYTMGLHKTDGNLDVAKRENAVILKEDNYQEKYKGFDPNSPLAHIMLANYQHAFMSSSINFAQKVEYCFRKHAERTSRGVKQAGFIVLWRTTMPSVLIETGYLTNPTEERYLASAEGQDEISDSIVRAFKAYKQEVDAAE
ncbi:N-acetylmuramoyl-L-alanine amidase family protein [Tellurirhabdus bombi]|uniref:N-acetylmuramoyl-L-alanine amidase family protein n=1 Tax=Tellurirhabdus bombi TaxID=2907205 RepID=UPI001F3330AA|nr:N-acetylmuramoyl-L-alanine amidase [Tellurirhabdus bombi]